MNNELPTPFLGDFSDTFPKVSRMTCIFVLNGNSKSPANDMENICIFLAGNRL